MFLSIRDAGISDDFFLVLQELWILGCCSSSGSDIVGLISTGVSESYDEHADVLNLGGQVLVAMDSDFHFVDCHTLEHIMDLEKKKKERFSVATFSSQASFMRADVELLITAIRNGKVILAAIRHASDDTSANLRCTSEGQQHSTIPRRTQVTLDPIGCNNAECINGNLRDPLSEECYNVLRNIYGMAYLTSGDLGRETVDLERLQCKDTTMKGWSDNSVVLQLLHIVSPELVTPTSAEQEHAVAWHLADVLHAMYLEMCDMDGNGTTHNVRGFVAADEKKQSYRDEYFRSFDEYILRMWFLTVAASGYFCLGSWATHLWK